MNYILNKLLLSQAGLAPCVFPTLNMLKDQIHNFTVDNDSDPEKVLPPLLVLNFLKPLFLAMKPFLRCTKIYL